MTAPGTAVRMKHNPKRWRRRPWHLVAAISGGFVMTFGMGRYLGSGTGAPEPPAIGLEEVDPAVAALVHETYAAVRRWPQSAATWGRLGMVLLAHDFFSEANLCLSQAERLDRQEARWPYYQGVALSLGDPAAAIPKLERAVALCGDAADAPRLRLAEMLLDQGRYAEAMDHFHELVRRDPGHPRAQLGLARLSYQREDLPGALAQLRQCADNLFTHKASAALLAEIRQRSGGQTNDSPSHPLAEDLPDDLAWPDPFMDEVERLKTGREGGIARMEWLLAQGRVSEAIHFLQERVRDDPHSDWAWLWLGRLLIQQEEFVAAEQALREAARQTPQSLETQFYLGVALYSQGKHGEAASYFRRATELKPDYALAHYNLGHCLIQEGRRTAALQAFRMAVRCKINFADAHVNLGDLLIQNLQYGEGLVQLQYALSLNPADPRTSKLLRTTLAHLAGCIGP